MALLVEDERASLVDADAGLSKLQDALETAVHNDALDREMLERLGRTAQDAVRSFKSSIPPAIDPVVGNEIRDRLIAILTPEFDESRPLDAADAVIIEAEAIRHIIRDLLQEHPPADPRDASECIGLLEEWLPSLSTDELAELIGISARQLQRLRHTTGRESSHRMQLVVRLATILRHAWTDRGVLTWFMRQRQELGGAAPIDLLDDPANERALMLAARAGRVQVAG